MTIFFPDISGYQTGVRLDGIPAVMVKATEGTGYVNPDYARVVGDARARGLLQMAYHFLRRGNGTGQADYAYSVIGPGVPTMVDVEPAGDGTAPSLADVFGFVTEYRARGGLVHLVYLPRWFWADLGSPDLTGLTRANLALVSSAYTAYSDSGPGWAPYGGVSPAIWQFTDGIEGDTWTVPQPINGYRLDMNAYRGSLDDLRALVTGDDMSALDANDPNWQVLIWRVEGLINGRTAVLDGPRRGEAIWPVAQIQTLEATVAGLQAAQAAERTALDALAALVQAGGGSIDGAALADVKAAVGQVGAQESAAVSALHDQIATLSGQLADAQARLAAAEQAAADVLKSPPATG